MTLSPNEAQRREGAMSSHSTGDGSPRVCCFVQEWFCSQRREVQLESQATFSLKTMKNNDKTNNTLEVIEASMVQLEIQTPFIPSSKQWKYK